MVVTNQVQLDREHPFIKPIVLMSRRILCATLERGLGSSCLSERTYCIGSLP